MAALRALLELSSNARLSSNCAAYSNVYRKCRGSGRYFVPVKWKSSTAAAVEASVSGTESAPLEPPPERDPLDLSFTDAKAAYKSKTTWELIRAYIVLKLTSSNYVVNNQEQLMQFGQKVLGKRLFRLLMKHTFYGHFVGGESDTAIQPLIKRLRSFGVKSILDYSAEEDLSAEEAKEAEMASCVSAAAHDAEGETAAHLKQFQPTEQFADRRYPHVMVRTYFYLNEAQCERNMATFLKCIDAVSGATKGTGLAAVKLTALGRPQLLMQLSEVVVHTRKYFQDITGADKAMALMEVTPTALEQKLPKVSTEHKDAFQTWLQRMDYDRKGLMNLFSWSGLVETDYFISDLFKVPNLKTGRMEPIISALTEEEEEMFQNMMRRVHTIARTARDKDVRVMIDAEQTYFQPGISRITMELMRKYNKQKAIIFNTYQCYLKEAYNNVIRDLELAKRQDFYFAAKLVRGAYMEQERLRAQTLGYEDPINPSYEATNEMYYKTLTELLRRISEQSDKKTSVMVASHNEDTIRFTVKQMKELGIGPGDRVVCFGQLLGMCDQVSFPLGQAGYSVYKYVPYGPIDEVMPYLSRRAVENNSLLQKVDKEIGLLKKEIVRRVSQGKIFYKPQGKYTPV